jgi:hypothetical protein
MVHAPVLQALGDYPARKRAISKSIRPTPAFVMARSAVRVGPQGRLVWFV